MPRTAAEPTERITIRCPASLADALRALADERYSTMSAEIKRGIQLALAQQ
jgi:hypothetical protein